MDLHAYNSKASTTIKTIKSGIFRDFWKYFASRTFQTFFYLQNIQMVLSTNRRVLSGVPGILMYLVELLEYKKERNFWIPLHQILITFTLFLFNHNAPLQTILLLSKTFFYSLTGMFFRPSSDFCFSSFTVVKSFSLMLILSLGYNKKKSQGARFDE